MMSWNGSQHIIDRSMDRYLYEDYELSDSFAKRFEGQDINPHIDEELCKIEFTMPSK